MDQMFGRKKASKTKTSTSESRLYLPQGATKASLLKPLKKMAAPNLSRSNSDTKLGHQKASLLTPSTDKAKSSVESKTEADNGRLYSTQSSPALLDLDLNEKSVRETASKPMPFVPIPLLRKSEHKPNASSYWRPQKPNNPPPDLDSIQRKSSENVHQNFCKKRPNSSKEDVNIEIDDLELENWPEKNIWTDSNGFSNFSDMDGIPDIMDIDYGEEPPPPGTEPNNAPTTFWTRQLDPVKRFMKSTLDSLQKVPRLINRSNDSSSEEESHENTVTSSLNEELQLRHILTLAYLDHFTLPGEELTEEELNKFMAMLVPEEDSERLLSEHITFYAENYANDNQLLVEVIYRALCNSEDEEVRSQSLGHLPTLMRFFERTGYKHHLLELLCAYINSIRRFDGGVEPQIEQKEQNLWEELNVPGTYSSNVLYLPLRKHSKSSKPTINQIMEVCYLVLSANFIDDERRNKIATTFTNFLDVIDKCTWKLRDEVFEFLADCLKFYHPDEYIQGHPIFEVFSHAALKNRADNRELAIKGLARIFELIFNNYSDEIAKSHSCVTLVILRTLVYTTLLENERNYRHRQRYYRFVVEVFELIGETTPVALLLQVFGMDVEAILRDKICLIRLYYPKIVDAIGLDYLFHLNAECSTQMVENLARLAQFDSDPEVRRAAKLVFLEREGFDSPDVLSDVDQMHPTLDMQIHYIPNLARAKFREPWSELAGWNVLNHMEDFVDAGPNYRVLSDVLSSTRKGPGEDDFHSAADWLTADDDKTASPDGNVGSVESTGTEGTGLGRSSIGGTGNETITAVTSIDGTGFGSTSTGTDGTTIGSMDTDDTGSDGGVKNNTIIDISGTDGPNGSINPSTSGVNGTITGAKDTDDMDAISTSAIDTELLCLGGTKMDVDGADTNGTITRDTVADSAMEVGTGTDGCSGGANTGGTDGMDGARVVGRMCKASTGSTDDGMDVRMNEASTGPIDRTMDCSSTGANDGRKLGDVTGGTDDGLRGSSTSGVTDETGSNGIELLEVVGTKLKEESDGSSTVSKEEEQIQIDDDDQGDCSQV